MNLLTILQRHPVTGRSRGRALNPRHPNDVRVIRPSQTLYSGDLNDNRFVVSDAAAIFRMSAQVCL